MYVYAYICVHVCVHIRMWRQEVKTGSFPLLFSVLSLFVNLLFIMPVSVLPACTSVSHVDTWCPRRPEENARPPGTGVTDGWSFHVSAGT